MLPNAADADQSAVLLFGVLGGRRASRADMHYFSLKYMAIYYYTQLDGQFRKEGGLKLVVILRGEFGFFFAKFY
jgi:hypothetical protein